MATLHISLFGSVSVCYDQGSEVRLTRILQSLLAYLCLQKGQMHPREVLIDLFWKDASEKQARARLNTALWRLRRALACDDAPGDEYLLTSPIGQVGFNPDCDCWLDVLEFQEQVKKVLRRPVETIQPEEALSLEEALALYTGELLEGHFDDWAIREREYLRQQYLNALSYLMEYYHSHLAYALSLRSGMRILACDPLREEIHRRIMRLYWESGQRPLAIHQYEACREVLQSEMGIDPMPETQALHSAILQNRSPFTALPAPAVLKQLPRLNEALYQLEEATQAFESAREQLRQAIEIFHSISTEP